ncbi:MAG TPA: hypothetical protein VFS59_11645, partial [Gemmatimonadaceae bacterium]|nr:hypothetical protein [Gemmatimonadaceae bacterium]
LRGGFDDHRAASYFTMLQGYETVEVEQALRLVASNGNPFVPAVSELIAAIESRSKAAIPTWPEALHLIGRALRRHGLRGAAEGLAMLAEQHPHVASFVAAYGWERLWHEPLDDPDRGGAVRRLMEQRYVEHVDRQEDRRRQGLALETTQRHRITGPRRIEPAMLGIGGAS